MSYYVLEDGTGNYVLEDGTGNYLIEAIVVANTKTLQYDIRGIISNTLQTYYDINGDASTSLVKTEWSITPAALNTEYTIVKKTDGPYHYAGWVYLDNMASGDTVEIRVYSYDGNDNTFGLYEKKTIRYSDLKGQEDEDQAAVFLPFIPSEQYKVTIEQTAGTLRTFTYILYKTQ